MRYQENLPIILSKLCIKIQSGERVGIVGRTGAGKSSIIQTIFRLREA
jgi:ABC-type multidrug transport system fused ATPase/permease subunit